jgi:hypothetical protein
VRSTVRRLLRTRSSLSKITSFAATATHAGFELLRVHQAWLSLGRTCSHLGFFCRRRCRRRRPSSPRGCSHRRRHGRRAGRTLCRRRHRAGHRRAAHHLLPPCTHPASELRCRTGNSSLGCVYTAQPRPIRRPHPAGALRLKLLWQFNRFLLAAPAKQTSWRHTMRVAVASVHGAGHQRSRTHELPGAPHGNRWDVTGAMRRPRR